MSLQQERDVELIKQTFKDKDASLLKKVRALFFGLELLPDEIEHIKSVFADKDLVAMMWRRFIPDIKDSRELPLGQVQDVWLGAEQMIFAAPLLQIEQGVKYKDRAIEMTKHALTLLQNPGALKVNYDLESYEKDPLQISLLARNMFIRHIDQQLLLLYVVGTKEEETEKESKERRLRNSTK